MIFIWLLFMKDETAITTVLSIKSWIKKDHYLPAIACLVYCVSEGYFMSIGMIDRAEYGRAFLLTYLL